MNLYLIVVIVLAIYCVLAWLSGTLLELQGSSLWALRGGLILIGMIAAGVFLWFHRKLKREQTGEPSSGESGLGEIAVLLQRANEKLRASRNSARFESFPIFFVLGESNSAKTSSIVYSGMEPELLAGSVFRDEDVAATSTINIWLAQGTIFIEAAGKVTADPRLWAELLRRTRPARLPAALGKGQQSPRGAMVCLECERLASSQNAGKVAGARLKEMARSLGTSFPVYVLFTKLDRIRYFADFMGTLNSEESSQVLGATLKRTAESSGVFAEEQSKRLTHAFDQLLYSLAEKRLEYLSREPVNDKLPGIYEFPRELKKIKSLAIQFLIDLSRPTQLGLNPFLRGFYFAGVRAITVNESVPLVAANRTAAASASVATRMFARTDLAPAMETATASRVAQSRRAPEWCFLPHLFTKVILRDPAIFSSGKQSTRVQQLRRVLLGMAAVLFLLYSAALLVSYFNNRNLRLEIQSSASALAASSGSPDTPGAEQLNQLERLRRSVERLSEYQHQGPPLGHRFGLYTGDRLYPEARNIYFAHFQRLLLGPAQATILTSFKQLKDGPSPTDDYSEPYNSLKAYLITTLRHDQSTRSFLAPVLLDRWARTRGIDPERSSIALKQFEFYSDELPRENVVPTGADMAMVERARYYLKQFNESEKIYQKMLSEAGRNNPSINFNRDFPGSAAAVLNNHEVPGAFTRGGYKAMQDVFRNPNRLFGGEEWVLGEPAIASASGDQIIQRLKERYMADYVSQWQTFLKATALVKYANMQDASGKLKMLSENRSPLLQLFWIAAQNTSVDSVAIAGQFQPVQVMGSGAKEQLIAGANQPYMTSLLALQNNVATLTTSYPNGTTDPAATAPVMQAASTAHGSVGQIAQGFRVDGQTHIDWQVRNLMEAPIVSAEALVRSIVPAQLNGAGKALCSQFEAIAAKYPFNPNTDREASLDDLKFFQPGQGAFWTFYDSTLKNLLVRQGPHFVPNPAATIRVSGQFIAFLDRAAALSDALYPPGSSAGPHLSYTLRQPNVKGIDHLDLTIDGNRLSSQGNKSQKFAWPGEENRGVRLEVSYGGGAHPPIEYPGLWGAFRFFHEANRWTSTANGTEFEWPLETRFAGRIVNSKETGLVVRYEAEGSTGQIFRKDFFAPMHCPALGAH